MFSEILKIKPQLDNSDLNKMERTLNARFRRVAKRFGRGITNVFKAAGGIGIVMSLINKFLNPLKEVQESIDRMLKSSDDIATNAKAFDTSSGKLLKIIKLADASGLDQGSLFTLLNKFQTGVGKVRANDKDPLAPILGQFTQDTDLVDSFYDFLNSVKALDQKDQAVVKNAVFGDRQGMKINDFLQQDFAARSQEIGLEKYGSDQLTRAVDKVGALSDYSDGRRVNRELEHFLNQSQRMNKQMIDQNDAIERQRLKQEVKRLEGYENLAAVTEHTERMMNLVEEAVLMFGSYVKFMTGVMNKVVGLINDLRKTRLFKGIGGWFGSKDGE